MVLTTFSGTFFTSILSPFLSSALPPSSHGVRGSSVPACFSTAWPRAGASDTRVSVATAWLETGVVFVSAIAAAETRHDTTIMKIRFNISLLVPLNKHLCNYALLPFVRHRSSRGRSATPPENFGLDCQFVAFLFPSLCDFTLDRLRTRLHNCRIFHVRKV